MGIDKSLTDDFPSVEINGMKYQYGRDRTYGQYLIENADEAKDYWCFDNGDDMRAFLMNLPESADRDWITRRHPDWLDVSAEQRRLYMEEHRDFLRDRMREKEKAGSTKWYNVLRFDDDAVLFYFAYANPMECSVCDNMEVDVEEQVVNKDGRKEYLIELKAEPNYGEEKKGVFKICRKQALKLATVLLQAAAEIEKREPAQ